MADAYADTFAHLCAGTIPALLHEAELDSDTDVLEVGAGTGLLSRAIAATGAGLTAVEPDVDMLRIAGDHVPEEVTLVRASLPRLPVHDASFDVVIANFVINHVGDPRAGVAELARATRPGGRVLFTVWPNRPTVQGTLFGAVLDASGATPPTFDKLPPEMDFDRSLEGTAALCRDVGLVDVRADEVSCTWRIHPNRFWRGLQAGIGGIGKALLQQDEATRRRMRSSYDDLNRELLDGDELVFPAVALLATATRARD
ncbi:hypothetical protein ASG90_16850 [Nocardioides sp. Soil797]|nr:hypothetical protein ASG90_16850 [Nocardioides sp. Soil797]